MTTAIDRAVNKLVLLIYLAFVPLAHAQTINTGVPVTVNGNTVWTSNGAIVGSNINSNGTIVGTYGVTTGLVGAGDATPVSQPLCFSCCPSEQKKTEPIETDGSYFTHQHWHRE